MRNKLEGEIRRLHDFNRDLRGELSKTFLQYCVFTVVLTDQASVLPWESLCLVTQLDMTGYLGISSSLGF